MSYMSRDDTRKRVNELLDENKLMTIQEAVCIAQKEAREKEEYTHADYVKEEQEAMQQQAREKEIDQYIKDQAMPEPFMNSGSIESIIQLSKPIQIKEPHLTFDKDGVKVNGETIDELNKKQLEQDKRTKHSLERMINSGEAAYPLKFPHPGLPPLPHPTAWFKDAHEHVVGKVKEQIQERLQEQLTIDDVACVKGDNNQYWCECIDCQEERHRLQLQLNNPFYKRTEMFRDQIKMETMEKAAKKYPEPFNPDSWTTYMLAHHAMAENYDQGNYINGLYERAIKLENVILNAISLLRDAQVGREDKMADALATVISLLKEGVVYDG
jgi:hypothetical protein